MGKRYYTKHYQTVDFHDDAQVILENLRALFPGIILQDSYLAKRTKAMREVLYGKENDRLVFAEITGL